MGAFLARSQHNSPILYIGVQRIAGADIKASAKRPRKNDLSLRGNLGLHSKTILPSFEFFGNHNRQQWNFSSPDATRESEEYNVDLPNVTLVDLVIDPDKGERQGSSVTLEFASSLTSCRRKSPAQIRKTGTVR